MFISVILTKSERRRSEGAWKDPRIFFYPYCNREYSQYLVCTLARSIIMVFLSSAFAPKHHIKVLPDEA
jgi:hypothetical protein